MHPNLAEEIGVGPMGIGPTLGSISSNTVRLALRSVCTEIETELHGF